MAGVVKALSFSEGVAVTAPAQSPLQASSLKVYASEAAYVAAKGSAAAEGDYFFDSTLKSLKVYEASAWKLDKNFAVSVYASEAAFVSGKGVAAAEGDFFFNSTTKRIEIYEGGAWKSESNFTVPVYATEAAYVSAKGSAAAEGDTFYNSTLKVQEVYEGGAWRFDGKVFSAASYANETAFTTAIGRSAQNDDAFFDSTAKSFKVYDAGTWRTVGGSGGGGGSSLKWVKSGTTSPETYLVDGFELESFYDTETMEIYTSITVPSSYQAGVQIKMVSGAFFCSSAAGNVFFKTQTALLRDASTVLGTYSNIHTSTNSQVTLSVSNQLKAIGDLQLTDASGQINGVAVAAGDKLRIRLYRDVASETSSATTAHLMIDNFEVKFTA
jgi:hypothetical protein